MDEELMAEVRSAMHQWRGRHPHATFAEIEQAVEEQIARIRVAMLEQVVVDGPKQEHVICQACGTTMEVRKQGDRELTVQGDDVVHLHRPYAMCPSCGTGLSPLDEELALLSGSFSPFIHQCIVRLGTILPFEQVPEQLAFLTGVQVSRETVRRLTEQAGAAQVAVEEEALRQVPREAEAPPMREEVQQLSADGAMVPLVHGTWTEVRTLTIGIVGKQPGPKGVEVQTHAISYPALPWPGGHPRGCVGRRTSSTGQRFLSSNGARSRPKRW